MTPIWLKLVEVCGGEAAADLILLEAACAEIESRGGMDEQFRRLSNTHRNILHALAEAHHFATHGE